MINRYFQTFDLPRTIIALVFIILLDVIAFYAFVASGEYSDIMSFIYSTFMCVVLYLFVDIIAGLGREAPLFKN